MLIGEQKKKKKKKRKKFIGQNSQLIKKGTINKRLVKRRYKRFFVSKIELQQIEVYFCY